jgi:hypothetical protein
MTAIFGYKGAKLKRAEEFYKKLKTKVVDRARVQVLQEIVKNAQTNGYGWTCIDDIQDAWKEAQSDEDIETLASKIKKCIHSGYFEESDDMEKHWKFKMEKELMEEFKVVYVEGDKNKSLGCIAKHVSRAQADVYKRIGRQGKRVHKHCPAIRGIAVKKSIGKEEENPIPKKRKQIQQVQIMNNKARNDLATTCLAIVERCRSRQIGTRIICEILGITIVYLPLLFPCVFHQWTSQEVNAMFNSQSNSQSGLIQAAQSQAVAVSSEERRLLNVLTSNSGGDNLYPATGRNIGLDHVLAEVQGKNGRKPTDKDNEQVVKDKEEDEEEEEDKKEDGDEEDEDDEDELGKLENVIKFFWSKRAPSFQVRWSKKGILHDQAIPVLLDHPYEALKLVWENHQKNLEILEWINSLEEMQEAVEGWDDIESYAFHNGWKGSFKVPNAALAAVKKKHKEAVVVDKRKTKEKTALAKKATRIPKSAWEPIGIPRSQFKEPGQDEVVGKDGPDVMEGMIGQDDVGMCHMSSRRESILDLTMFFDY